MDKITIARVGVTVVSMVCFIALTIWAYSRKNSHAMEAVGRSVVEDQDYIEEDANVTAVNADNAVKGKN